MLDMRLSRELGLWYVSDITEGENRDIINLRPEFSEYSVNYPLKSGLETIDFSEDFGDTVEMGWARNRALTRHDLSGVVLLGEEQNQKNI